MRRTYKILIIIFAALFLICVAVLNVVPYLQNQLEKTYVAQYGTLDVTKDVTGYIVRDEAIYLAEEDCKITRKVSEGELVKARTRVLELEAVAEERAGEEASGGVTSDAGYVSYFVDGQENELCIENLDLLTKKDLEKRSNPKLRVVADKECSKGDPLFKITKNKRWYMIIFLDNKTAERFPEGRKLTFDMNGQDAQAVVESVKLGKKNSRITLSCKSFTEDFLKVRKLETRIIIASADGLILKSDSVFEDKNGQIGVFTEDKFGNHNFTPVALMADNGEECVAHSEIYVNAKGEYVETIKPYDVIIEDPTHEDLASIGIAPEDDMEKTDQGEPGVEKADRNE